MERNGKAQVVLLCGVSGAGKTREAQKLAQEGYRPVSADAWVWDRYGRELFSLSPERRMEVFREAHAATMEKLKQLLALGCRVVVDSTMCKRWKRDEARRICREAGASCRLMYLTAPEPELLRRLEGRRGTCADDQPVSPEALSRFLANFEVPAPDELM